MKVFKYIALFACFLSSYSYSADIGFGTIFSIKNYNFSSYKAIKVYLSSNATHITEICKNDRGLIEAELVVSGSNQKFVDRTLGIALSAYHAGKKVRLYSEGNACKIDLIAIEEVYL